MRIAWVLGSGGLLGKALCRELSHNGTLLFLPQDKFSWRTPVELEVQFAAAVQAFALRVGTADRWEIYWAAGVGTMGSATNDLEPETHALEVLLRLLETSQSLMSVGGAVAFASSAGAIYGGSRDVVINEDTSLTPTTAYAREKLVQERLVSSFSLANQRISALIARMSTMYGPGQSARKQQGLLTHVARRILRNQPIQIYVPYDTIRDYISVDDAATAMVATLRIASETPRVLVKIVASEHPTTIAEILSIFKRIARRPPLIVTSASRLSGLYTRRVQFRSNVLPGWVAPPRKSLPIGIAELMTAERAAFVRSRPQ